MVERTTLEERVAPLEQRLDELAPGRAAKPQTPTKDWRPTVGNSLPAGARFNDKANLTTSKADEDLLKSYKPRLTLKLRTVSSELARRGRCHGDCATSITDHRSLREKAMSKTPVASQDAAERRRRAEEQLKCQRPEGAGQRSEAEMARLVHELEVHQIELEMQNEELQHAHAMTDSLLAQYTDLYDFAPSGYMTLDREGAIRHVNLTGARLLGAERARLVNRRFGLFVAEGERRVFSDFLQQAFASHAKERCEVALPQEGQQPRFVLIEGWISAEGQECRVVVVDITERKRAEEEIHRLNAELEQRVLDRTAELRAANEDLDSFSYSVSHDLRAPLRAINGYACILREDHAAQLDSEGRRIAEIIAAEGRRMGLLINDLLAFSRLGRQPLRRSHIDMEDLARTVFAELAGREPGRTLRLSLDALPPACGDPAMVRQVWVNLLSNAVKYTSPREVAEIRIGSRTEGGEIVYFVQDNGVGFDMKYAGKLFGVFQRLHSGAEFEGTGAGLALVQRILVRHGGRIWADAKFDAGATFSFVLPQEGNT